MATFQYQGLSTPVHQLHALAKFSILVTLSLLAGFILDPRYKIPLLALIMVYGLLARLPWRDYVRLLVLITVTFLLANAISSIFIVNPSLFKVYPQQWAGTVLFQITPASFPVLGKIAITNGGLLWLSTLPLTAIAVVLLVAVHIHTTSLNETVQALSALKAPFPVVYITMVALRFTPEVRNQFTLIHRAQTLRGWRVNTRNPIKVIRLYSPLLVPLVRNTIKSIDITTMSTQNRAFGLGKVTNMYEGKLSTLNWLVIIGSWLFFAAMMILIFGFNVGNL